jgi:hypothetical protein
MELRMRAMNGMAVTAVLALVGFGFWPMAPAAAQNAGAAENAAPAAATAPNRVRPRPPARIRVHPLTQTLGPDAVRQCESWLATENRPSGTVIVPKMRCWWERG